MTLVEFHWNSGGMVERFFSGNTRTTLRFNFKMFDGNDLAHELLLTTRQKTKLRNAFNNNTSADIRLSKV